MRQKYIYLCRIKDKTTGFYYEQWYFKPKGKVLAKEIYRFTEAGTC